MYWVGRVSDIYQSGKAAELKKAELIEEDYALLLPYRPY
jgi:hypothetical protein